MQGISVSMLSPAAVAKVRRALAPGATDSVTRRQAIGSSPLTGVPSAASGWASSAGSAKVRLRPMKARRSVMQSTASTCASTAATKCAAATTGSPCRRGLRAISSARQPGSQRLSTNRLAKAGWASSAFGFDSTGSKYEISSRMRASLPVLCSSTVRSSVSSSGLISTVVRACRPGAAGFELHLVGQEARAVAPAGARRREGGQRGRARGSVCRAR